MRPALRGRPVGPAASRRVGVEHEYVLRTDDGPLDARLLLPTLSLDGQRLDPGDRHAVRCGWGGVVTADGREIEVATPPARLGSDGVAEAVSLSGAGAAAVLDALPEGVRLSGYSTHLNVEVDERRARWVAHQMARRVSPALMLLLDRASSPGLLVRPRFRRLEIGGEYCHSDELATALCVTAGTALVFEAASRSRRARRDLPPQLRLRLGRDPQRFGWYVDRRAGGEDLYVGGRSTVLRSRVRGRTRTAQDVLEAAWELARPAVAPYVSESLLARTDAVVSGDAPLPLESAVFDAEQLPAQPAPGPHLPSLDVRRRGSVTLTPVAATWHALALRAEAGDRVRYLRVPGEETEAFLTALDAGELDGWLLDVLESAGGRP